MSHRRSVRVAPLVALLIVLAAPGCEEQTPAPDVGCGDGGGIDGGGVDSGVTDSWPLEGGPGGDACDPGCHWDCFTSALRCVNGKVYSFAGGAPYPCCKSSDPWPGGGPACSVGVVHTCKQGCVKQVDQRYRSCLDPPSNYAHRPFEGAHIVKLACQETTFKGAGDACTQHTDCRPAAGADRLECDPKGGCVAVKRPAAPGGFGSYCGITPKASKGWDSVVMSVGGSPCHVAWDSAKACWRQGWTMTCQYDEDCPLGTVCLCSSLSSYSVVQVCAAATDRATQAGRAAGLACPGAAQDAGPDAGADAAVGEMGTPDT